MLRIAPTGCFLTYSYLLFALSRFLFSIDTLCFSFGLLVFCAVLVHSSRFCVVLEGVSSITVGVVANPNANPERLAYSGIH